MTPPTETMTETMPNIHANGNGSIELPVHQNGTPKSSLSNGRQEMSVRSSEQSFSSKYKHAFAVHAKNRTTCLSRESEQQVSFLGFKNLAFSVLACMILRLMIENFKKYGIRVTLSSSGPSRNDLFYGLWLYFTVPCHFFVALAIEKLAAGYAMGAVGRVKRREADNNEMEAERRQLLRHWRVIGFLHAVNISINLVYSTFVVYFYIHNPGIGTLCELHAVIVWLKVCSYALTNRDLRHALLKPDPAGNVLSPLYKSCPYPKNITISNLCYFWWAPTLIYQPVYPRTDKIRWIWILQRLGEMVIACFIVWVASAQYAVPLLQNSLADISKLDMINMFERVLKLSTISTVCWLAGFYALFQAGLNALAEFMRFGDREFYGDWWNCSDVRSYWTSWNKPVSSFMKRHVYTPMLARGWSPTTAAIVTFLLSAALHELLVGVPTHNIIGIAFAGMALQIPLIIITDRFRRMKGYYPKLIGNLIFWSSFCLVGQPVAALGYYFAWQAKYGNSKPDYPTLWHWAETRT
ncbi:hypothetical protein AMS68_005473 [Peltaster fructicola]|uniref:O-acyltransferase n=1 Tax=Peltaster fructicola TaxID=286661 RepID=A0A6H0XZ50_9PEZI|nr:hypothetical protein AMS68_005473 [Peltaster fructicola]